MARISKELVKRHDGKAIIPARIDAVDRIASDIEIFVQRKRIVALAFKRICRPEASSGNVQIPGAVVVEAEVGVELFAREEVVVGGRARGTDQVAEGVVVVGNY